MITINPVGGTEEILEAVLAEGASFGFQTDEKILIVEGSDDIQVIKKYYFYQDKPLPFRVVKPEEVNERISGKKTALKFYDEYNEVMPNIHCLLDRDFDFVLGLNREDSRIFYYDYYELESYLFEDKLLKILISRFYDTDEVSYRKVLSKFNEIAKLFEHFSHLCLSREIYFHEGNETVGRAIASAAKSNLFSVLEDSSQEYKGLNHIDKVKKYLNKELSIVNMELKDIHDLLEDEAIASTSLTTQERVFDFFRNFISSKYVIKSLIYLLKNYVQDPPFNNAGATNSLERDLKNEWIPTHSLLFRELMTQIES